MTYTPSALRDKGIRIWGEMFRELKESRGLVWRLFVRDWTGQFRQAWLGYLWAFLPPILAVLGFAYLSKTKVLNIGETRIPYIPYALFGLALWQLFLGIYRSTSEALAAAGDMLIRVSFPRDALVFAAIGRPLFEFLIRMVAVIFFMLAYDVSPKPATLLLPLAVLPIILMATGIGMAVSVISVTGTDIMNALSLGMGFGIVVTPVLYPPPSGWPSSMIMIANPLSGAIAAAHDLVEIGTIESPELFISSWLWGILIFGCGWRFFRIAMPRIIERL